jgi:Arc/MetJ-type ribon-helix-helix transcriptional regulator
MVRLGPDQLQRLDDWIEEDGGRFSRPEAIRRLLEHAWGRTVASRGIKTLPPRLNELPE